MIREMVHHELTTRYPGVAFDVSVPPDTTLGDYSTNIAFALAKQENTSPMAVAERLAREFGDDPRWSRVQAAAPGFVNFTVTDALVQESFAKIVDGSAGGIPQTLRGKRVVVEYTDPNPFKQFHIGHLMTNVIGESIARLYEAVGAEVIRVTWQGDVGVHVASSVWGMIQLKEDMPPPAATPAEQVAFLGRAYAAGAKAYKENPEAKAEIDAINKKIYERSDEQVNALYDQGRRWSLEYFETMYARLGSTFTRYFFESEEGPKGLALVKAHPEVFKESEGAVVFMGEEYGLHTRVFINAHGLPTYEAKELGLNQEKFNLFHPDLSVIVTGNEINEYFRVLLKVMEILLPDVAAKTTHLGHGMLRLPTGKMSSRTGQVITAEELLDQIKQLVGEKIKDHSALESTEREEIQERVALAAIRYTILRQGIGKDIIFDLEKSVAFTGDSGPYLQYTYARLAKVLKSSGQDSVHGDCHLLTHPHERAAMLKVFDFPDVVARASATHAPSEVARYLHDLSLILNGWYESQRILDDAHPELTTARLTLSQSAVRVLKQGLGLLGIETLERI